MMGELWLYSKNSPPSELDAMTFTKMQFWHKFYEQDNERIRKENRRQAARKKYHPDA